MKCHLCGSDASVLLTERLRSGPGRVWYCEACGLGMLEDARQDSRQFYDGEYRKRFGPDLSRPSGYPEIFSAYVGYQDRRLSLLLPHLHPGMRLLEVGCSTGHFLHHIRNHVQEAIGVDYDSGAAGYAASVTGCRTYGCSLEETDLEKGSFDVVCAIQTLEHVGDPTGFIRLLSRYLRPGGILYIEVPNLQDPLLALYRNRAYHDFYFHEAHLFYFTPRSLGQVMEKAGMAGEIRFFQDYSILNHLHWVFRDRPQATCHEGLSSPRLPVDPGAPAGLKGDLESFWSETDSRYREILARYGYTDNMAFIGQRAGS